MLPPTDVAEPSPSPASGPMSVAVIIVNWNGWQLSLDCLASLRRSEGIDWHLYLVDNASTDASADHLRALGDDVTVLFSDVNGGWTGGNNLAIRRALDDGFDNIFILNNDAQVLPETMNELLRTSLAHGGDPILGPLHLSGDGGTPEFVGATVNSGTGLADITNIDNVRLDDLPPLYATAFIKGAGIFANRRHFKTLGLFDDAYFLNYDDTDWAFRARKAGYPLIMVRSAHIIHDGSGSIGGGYSPLNVYFLARNQLLFAERHCRLAQRPRQIIEFIRQGNRLTPARSQITRLFALLFGRSRLALAWRAGVRDYLLRRFGDCPPSVRRLSVSNDVA
ncbi:glycosyltransferase family 2 protein [Sphingomonas bacterium]|uniref:glycosyltransferase family 2 protein n=1 Tax=Sphingomonas bacterium TaxID=1895847 RepID=UPI0015772C9A|nr:glycosyltransferase family 2 protein [Sphingomonas bacterium]